MVAYKSKVVERIHLPSKERRTKALEEAGYNAFNLPADDVFIDLLTDSGTGAMSDDQWAALLQGDEAYAGSASFDRLESAVADVMGFDRVVPAHQGRGAENVLYGSLLSEGDVALNNTHFDTTRAHVSNQGADPVDCPVAGAHDPATNEPFKGDFSLERARAVVDEVGAERVPLVILTITNNSTAGQPVSVANTRRVRAFADEIDATFVIDACRFAENAYFVTRREDEFADARVPEVAREQLGLADALVMSGKKDGLANVGGFVATDDEALFERCKQRAILYEGFPTYGGMAGRDVAAMAVGLREAVEEAYIEDRVEQVRELGAMLEEAGVPVYTPTGGHAVYLDAGATFPDIPAEQFPGQALVCELYREGGVRGVELGSFAFPETDRPELVRLAVPRRTYHREHFEHVVETAEAVLENRQEVSGLEIVSNPAVPELRHFSAALEPLSTDAPPAVDAESD
ncbi:tryptophanase [Natrinema longum]|uniref:Tryptophanase n=1 Tax=Natrinema longum TaxID=370324 RepID=A0A8A2UF48_9EURY|nr:tryptophanase [Natrinema longum]MBZ6495663.1 tryptophanase [Natrinema longum]QSW86378.1 tryptophanase [Natrinema longum]